MGGSGRGRGQVHPRAHPCPSYFLVLLAALSAAPLAAQDTVVLRGKGGGETRATGRIADFTGRELSLEMPGGTIQRFPAEQVVQVQTPRTPEQTRANEHLARGEFAPALTMYREALDTESRRWVRREILAQAVRCYEALGRAAKAGTFFLLILADDPQTPHFDGIPLGWLPGQPDAALEQAARDWYRSDRPAAVLLGASHLLSTSLRPQVVRRLGELRGADDPRVAMLAEAQLWRAEGVQSTAAQRAGWLRRVEAMPETLRAGPYFALGLAQAQAGEHEQAALSLLRVAIVYPRHRPLAARAALEAARALERIGRADQAARLYHELIDDYQDQPRVVAEARTRLKP